MKKVILSLLIACAAVGCAQRGNFPGAKSADIIACREYASHYGAIYVNSQFNDCMEEAGYTRRD